MATKVKVLSGKQLMQKKFKLHKLTDQWQHMFGDYIEMPGMVFVFGESGNGKTYFCLEWVKFIASNFGVVDYNSIEEGISYTQQRAWEKQNVFNCKHSTRLLDKMSFEDFCARLKKQRATKFPFIDSWQYAKTNFHDFLSKKNELKVFWTVISHVDRKQPVGQSAKSMHFDADIKVYIEGFVAFPKSRFGGNKPWVIWEEGARRCHGDNVVDKIMSEYNF